MQEYFLELQDYIVWLNHKVIFVADQLSVEEYFLERDYHHGSLHGCFLHALAGEYVWRTRCAEKTTPSLDEFNASLNDLDAIRQFWQKEHRAMHDFLKSLRPQDFDQNIEYDNGGGEKETLPLLVMLNQNFYHSKQLFTEASMLLSGMGYSPGNIDYIIHYLEKTN